MIQTKVNNNYGYTIVELLVALIVGGILITAITTIVTTQGTLTQRSRDLVISSAFAEAKFEAIRSAGYLSLSDGATDITSEMPVELNDSRNAEINVSSPSAGIKKVELEITYNSQGSSRTNTYTTYIGELGVGQN